MIRVLKDYDIIVVGGGHAGCEASAVAARMGMSVLLITHSLMDLARLSCNPSMGGIAKGQILREIDALGGYSGIVADKTMIQFRMLNKSKGPAMWSPRTQNDRVLFSIEWRNILENIAGLDFWQDTVVDIKVKNDKVCGVITAMGLDINAKAVIITTGTFLNGKIFIGELQFSGGRIGELPAKDLTENLVKKGIKSDRLKTGTPVRIDGRSIDFSKMVEQKGDEKPGHFSFLNIPLINEQKSCFITWTNEKVHDILRTGFDKSPLFIGRIKGKGPRYCPSIEDKIYRFSDKNQHQLFIEPEGKNTFEYYVNGFSSSLPIEVQFEALKYIPGLENAKIIRPGYAIEYDYFPPSQLNFNLESKIIENLFFAGQVNATTGYEEAAAQGLMAGINAALKLKNLPPFILKRHQAYIGVLIDDLITKEIDEPYRMFTSRAEYRILLRQDNADNRLTPLGFKLGIIPEERFLATKEKYQTINLLIDYADKITLEPEIVNPILTNCGTSPVMQRVKVSSLIVRPQVKFYDLWDVCDEIKNHELSYEFLKVIEEAEIIIKYKSYIVREQEIADKLSKFDELPLKSDFDYYKLKSLSYEAREKLSKIKPATIGQAARISGVSPADISILLLYLGR
ncbi:MAG TPA: tRNA uridine-5-carboxymethylaminomethyl(34) synthesis enzyme MnmG [Bacteroidales bacterium]|nr:tRNA uridine-5-carboxymethylaminomethyl(34) synthesis enzyme MnmG [Bacteroidales bacterium]